MPSGQILVCFGKVVPVTRSYSSTHETILAELQILDFVLLVAFDAHAGIPCCHHRQTELWSLQSAYPTGAGMY